jgi:hypothetical protein
MSGKRRKSNGKSDEAKYERFAEELEAVYDQAGSEWQELCEGNLSIDAK